MVKVLPLTTAFAVVFAVVAETAAAAEPAPKATLLANVTELPGQLINAHGHGVILGALVIAILVGWRWMPAAARKVPGPLVAIVGVTALSMLAVFSDVGRIQLNGSLLDALALWARGQGLQWLWLEVRVSNERARAVYQSNGFQQVGLRKRYYPAAGDAREDAIVMSRAL